MNKLRIEDIRVESFTVTEGAAERGTVAGREDTLVCDAQTPNPGCTVPRTCQSCRSPSCATEILACCA